jgi:ubiquinol-cytochrome c reductase cytochrome b subunit
MLPHGEFIEVHEPLSPEKAYVLTQHEQNPPLAISSEDAQGVANPQGIKGRIRTRLSQAAQEQIAKPTSKEILELEEGHH